MGRYEPKIANVAVALAEAETTLRDFTRDGYIDTDDRLLLKAIKLTHTDRAIRALVEEKLKSLVVSLRKEMREALEREPRP